MPESSPDGWVLSDAALQKVIKAVRQTLNFPRNTANIPPAKQPFGTLRIKAATNNTGSQVGPRSLVAVSTANGTAHLVGDELLQTVPSVVQASTNYAKQYAITVGEVIDNGDVALVSLNGGEVTYQGTVPGVGQSVGPVSGSFAVSTTGAPYFTVVGVSTQFSLVDVVPYQPATISPVTLSGQLPDGNSLTVTLSDGRQVSAENKSGQTLEAGNALCVADPFNGLHYITGSAKPSTVAASTVAGSGIPWFYGTVALASDANMADGFNVDNVVTLDGSTWPATTFQINNPLQLTGAEDDPVLFVQSSTARSFSPQGYVAAAIMRRQPREFKGVIPSTGLDSTSVTATIESLVALDAAPTTDVITVANPFGLWAESGDYCRVIEDLSSTGAAYILEEVKRRGPYLGKTDAAVAKGNTVTVSIYAGSTEVDTGDNVVARSRFGPVASGKWVWVDHNGTSWYIIGGEC